MQNLRPFAIITVAVVWGLFTGKAPRDANTRWWSNHPHIQELAMAQWVTSQYLQPSHRPLTDD